MTDELIHVPFNLQHTLSAQHITLLVAPSTPWAEYWHACLKFWLPENYPIYWFNDWETLPYDQYSPHPDLISERLRTLAELPTKQHAIVVVTTAALRQRLAPQTHFDRWGVHLSIGDKLDRHAIVTRLEQAGYTQNTLISDKGEYAARGAIVDLFPMGASHPIRLEWFDDEIDSIRHFDLETQLTINKLDHISILPRSELDLSDAGRVCFRQSARQILGDKIIHSPLYERISTGQTPQGLDYYLPLFFDDTATFFEYLPPHTRVLALDGTKEALRKHDAYTHKRYERLNPLRQGLLLAPERLWVSSDDVLAKLDKLAEQPYQPRAQAIPFTGNETQREQQWLQTIEQASQPVYLHFSGQGRREHWFERLHKRNLSATLLESHQQHHPIDDANTTPTIYLLVSPLQYSFRSELAIHLAESDLHAGHQTPNFRRVKHQDAGEIIESLQDLVIGSPVVHIDHGVGRYQGLKRLEAEGEELMTIEYAKGSTLYVPINDMDLITRYSGASPENAPLHDIGGKQWQSTKRKIKQTVNDTATELLAIYAEREATTGTPIVLDQPSIDAFAADFPYEETPDQRHAIDAVLADLARTQPMDRIVCGDVGFGKTEVALRAAYAVVLSGAQVAFIAPTTLLANQHYLNFLDRFADYGVSIDMVSRFKTAGEQKKTLEKVNKGQIDIIIGTHRLLQKDVAFKSLGLVIVDEEQRFGVRHKERLKSLRANVNLLTLTATPIPRTLNMALSGLRDLSIIATPPVGRQSVQTIVSEWDLTTIEEACEREMRRGGQIFFLHNDIASIDRIARIITETLPDMRVAMVHGQMHERELESIMLDFHNRRYDLLIATTIIESGIDIPNANTIIINRADKLGLAQLHQLRGRVGRSHHQAYAYLFTPAWSSLSKDAQRRLDAFTTLDSLGAGFLLASQDLEIRGAGEILGDEQSGQIQQIGMSYYLELLERAVQAIKNGDTLSLEASAHERIEVEISEPALLPDNYIYDPQIRLACYQRLAKSNSQKDIDELVIEWIDRFGNLPEYARYLVDRARLRLRAKALGIVRLEVNDSNVELVFNDQPNMDAEVLFKRIQADPAMYQMRGQNHLNIVLEKMVFADTLDFVNTLLDDIAIKATDDSAL